MPPAFSIRAMSSPFAGYTEAIVRLFRQSPSYTQPIYGLLFKNMKVYTQPIYGLLFKNMKVHLPYMPISMKGKTAKDTGSQTFSSCHENKRGNRRVISIEPIKNQ